MSDIYDGDDLDEEIEVARPFFAADEKYLTLDGDVRVPDVLGEVLGWRVWSVKHPFDPSKATLHSLGAGGRQHAVAWTPGKVMEAFCTRSHDVPDKNCGCGFYSAKDRDHLLSMSYHRGDDFDDPSEVL